ncbi:nuclear transport factor 2 family protein [uncultured Roseibium sp.]|uniref:YybH family protein n=1 Tax=uncultured Roseibium sp. TaxID=1936171 RepID=UPI0026105D50|nr:nuclear transport factor 2 family protein [uncultured Roseibium sp.]
MSFKSRTIGFSIALVLSVAPLAVSADQEGAIAALKGLNDRFNEAASNHDAAGILSLYADDTVWIAPGKPAVKGLEEPRKLFEFVTSNKGDVSHSIDTLFVSDDGTLAVMIGSVDAKIESAGMDATGTFLYVLRPGDQGWEVAADMWHQHEEQR